MGPIAFLFPGQGSQAVGMGRDLAERDPQARALFDEASRLLGFDLARLCFEGPEAELALTANTQPAILTVSVALHAALARERVRPDFMAGHSLGEYSALVAAGALAFADAVKLVRERGLAMQAAVPPGRGAMAAIVGLDAELVAVACQEAAQGAVVQVANHNAPGQVVIAGEAGAVARAVAAARARGARRALPLPVSAPFHCQLMAPAAERLGPLLRGVPFADPDVPVISNVEAAPVREGGQLAELLTRQITAPVRWEEGIRHLSESGVGVFVEVGPGQVLSGLVRRIIPGARVWSVQDGPSLQATLEALRTPVGG